MNLTVNKIYKYLGMPQKEGGINCQGDRILQAICVDSRKVSQDSLFVAIPGEKTDGHMYIGQAINQGAIAILAQADKKDLCQQFEERAAIIYTENTIFALGKIASGLLAEVPSVKKIAVTGSVGKTTTKEMIAGCLAQIGQTHKTEGNQNSEIGLPLTIFALPQQSRYAVCEMGMRGLGQIEYLTEIYKPDIALITNIGLSHIEILGTQDNILKAKLEIVKSMEQGTLLLNADDVILRDQSRIKQILAEYGKENIDIKYYGENPISDFRMEDYCNTETNADAVQCFTMRITSDNVAIAVELKIPGKHNCSNACCALACAYLAAAPAQAALAQAAPAQAMPAQATPAQAMPAQATPAQAAPAATILQNANKFISSYESKNSIRQTITQNSNFTIIDDTYNASPDSMKASLGVLASTKANIKVAVLADMLELGTYTQSSHVEIGSVANESSDMLIAYGTHASYYTEKYSGLKEYTNDINQLFYIIDDIIEKNKNTETTVAFLVKGSNSMGMNKVAHYIQEKTK